MDLRDKVRYHAGRVQDGFHNVPIWFCSLFRLYPAVSAGKAGQRH